MVLTAGAFSFVRVVRATEGVVRATGGAVRAREFGWAGRALDVAVLAGTSAAPFYCVWSFAHLEEVEAAEMVESGCPCLDLE